MEGPIECRYVFLDIVGYSKRTVEAQAEISLALNTIVREALSVVGVPEGASLFLPTGDGMCIALAAFKPELYNQVAFDLHISLACTVLKMVSAYNASTADLSRQFSIRIGINENVDNAIIDINGNQNVAGAGINAAQRIMDAGGGGQILVGRRVQEVLRSREKYLGHNFKEYSLVAKHGEQFQVYQYFGVGDEPWLNRDVPNAFRGVSTGPRLTVRIACFIIEVDVHRTQLVELNQRNRSLSGAWAAFWMRSEDWQTYISAGAYDAPNFISDGFPNKDVIKYINSLAKLPFGVISQFEHFVRVLLTPYSSLFETSSPPYLFPNVDGVVAADSVLSRFGDGPREAAIRRQQQALARLETVEQVFSTLAQTMREPQASLDSPDDPNPEILQ